MKLRRSLAGGLAVSLLSGAFVAAAVTADGSPSDRFELATGSAWFASPRPSGSIALIDGEEGRRIVKVPVSSGGRPLDVVQSGSAALVVDPGAGTVTRVDGATWSVSKPVPVAAGRDDDLRVLTSRSAVWVVSKRSTVRQRDPVSLDPIGDALSTPGPMQGVGVGDDGALWVVDDGGEVRSYRDGAVATTVRVQARDPQLVMADGTPVVVDWRGGRAVELDAETGQPERTRSFDWPTRTAPLVAARTSGRRWLVAVDGDNGQLQVVDLRTGKATIVALGESGAGRYGGPVERGGQVFVPDIVAGTVIVVDPTAPGDGIVRRVPLGWAEARVRLSVDDDRVFFDEPDGDRVGVITDDLEARLASKAEGDGESEAQGADDQPLPPGPPPSVSCTSRPNPARPGEVVTFDAISTTDDPVDVWEWNAAGGTPSSGEGPQFTTRFDTVGSFGASLVATVGGVQSSVTCPVDVTTSTSPTSTTRPPDGSTTTVAGGNATTTSRPPSSAVSFTWVPQSPSAGQAVTFTNSTPGNPPVGSWSFQGGTPASSPSASPSVTWSSAGSYTVTLTLRDGRVASKQVTVVPKGRVTIPSLRGLTQSEAKTTLEGLGLRLGTVTRVDTFRVLKDRVVLAPTDAEAGSAVDIVLSTGIPRVDLVAGGGTRPSMVAGTATQADLVYPKYPTQDGAGNVYFIEDSTCRVVKVDPAGAITAWDLNAAAAASGAGPGCNTGSNDPYGLAAATNGDVYFGYNNGLKRLSGGVVADVSRFSRDLELIRPTDEGPVGLYEGVNVAAFEGQFARVDGLTATPFTLVDGGMLFSEFARFGGKSAAVLSLTGTYVQVDGANLMSSSPIDGTGEGNGGDGGPSTSAENNCANVGCGLAFDGVGGLLLADSGNNRIRRIDLATGTITNFAGAAAGTPGYSGDGGPATAALFDYPTGITLAPDGTILVADSNNHRIRRLS